MGKTQAGVWDGSGSFSREVGIRKQRGEHCPFDDDDESFNAFKPEENTICKGI